MFDTSILPKHTWLDVHNQRLTLPTCWMNQSWAPSIWTPSRTASKWCYIQAPEGEAVKARSREEQLSKEGLDHKSCEKLRLPQVQVYRNASHASVCLDYWCAQLQRDWWKKWREKKSKGTKKIRLGSKEGSEREKLRVWRNKDIKE